MKKGLLVFLFVTSTALAGIDQDVPVVEESTELAVLIEYLGEHTIVRKLPDIDINNVRDFFPSAEQRPLYKSFRNGKFFGHTVEEIVKPIDAMGGVRAWQRNIGEHRVEEWRENSDGSIHLVAETNTELGYRVEIQPPVTIPTLLHPGQTWSVESSLEAYSLDHLDELAYSGTLRATRRYEGGYELDTPAGRFNTVMFSESYKINIGVLNIVNKRYRFYARDIGKVAEIEGLYVSAMLLYRSKETNSKVLQSLARPREQEIAEI